MIDIIKQRISGNPPAVANHKAVQFTGMEKLEQGILSYLQYFFTFRKGHNSRNLIFVHHQKASFENK
jgi:hypothetical protein